MSKILEQRQNTNNPRIFPSTSFSKYQNKKFSLNSITYRASQLWATVSEEIKNYTLFQVS